MVLLVFQAFVKPVAHIIMRSMCTVLWIAAGSFTTAAQKLVNNFN